MAKKKPVVEIVTPTNVVKYHNIHTKQVEAKLTNRRVGRRRGQWTDERLAATVPSERPGARTERRNRPEVPNERIEATTAEWQGIGMQPPERHQHPWTVDAAVHPIRQKAVSAARFIKARATTPVNVGVVETKPGQFQARSQAATCVDCDPKNPNRSETPPSSGLF